ncbi:MAG: hypothetical protein FWD95_04040 [Nocardioidaceae bacterium]|nr:hypothetical protein [Nocardioidaceae bacterium]
MPDVEEFAPGDWEWLRRVLGHRANDPEYPDRVEAAIALRDAGMTDQRIREWTDVVDAHPNRFNVFMDTVTDRILDLDQHGVTPIDGTPWLFDNVPVEYIRLLLNAERTPTEYHAFLEAAWKYAAALPTPGGNSAAGVFLVTWLFATTFPADEALAYALAHITPNEAVTTWEPLRQTDPQRWTTTLQLMAALNATPDTPTPAT